MHPATTWKETMGKATTSEEAEAQQDWVEASRCRDGICENVFFNLLAPERR